MGIKEDIERVLATESYKTDTFGTPFQKEELENIHILRQIYNQTKNKKIVIDTILKYQNKTLFYLNFEFLIRIKQIKEAFNELLGRLESLEDDYRENKKMLFMFSLCRLLFLVNHINFTSKEIDEILGYVRKLPRGMTQRYLGYSKEDLRTQSHLLRANVIRSFILKSAKIIEDKYKGELLEEDLEEVIKIVRKTGLGEDIAKTFERLWKGYSEAKDDIDYNIYSKSIRGALMEIVKKICSKTSKEKIKDKDNEYRRFLQDKKIISKQEKELLDAFYSFLSSEAVHCILTSKEYYRVSLNIASQIALILVQGYKNTLPIRKTIPS